MTTQINGNTGVNRVQPLSISADDFEAALFLASKTANGYTYLPNGLILQWGTDTTSIAEGARTVSFPIAFTNAFLCMTITGRNPASTNNQDNFPHFVSATTTQFTYYNQIVGTTTVNNQGIVWFAIGH